MGISSGITIKWYEMFLPMRKYIYIYDYDVSLPIYRMVSAMLVYQRVIIFEPRAVTTP